MKQLAKEQIKMLHSALVEQYGGQDGLRDEGMLDYALNAPFQTLSGSELYPDLLSKAARLAFGLIANHPFIDGNKAHRHSRNADISPAQQCRARI